jgi:hypothetical protein
MDSFDTAADSMSNDTRRSGRRPSGRSPTKRGTATATGETDSEWDEIITRLTNLKLGATHSNRPEDFQPSAQNVSPTQESASATTSANASQWPRSIMVTPKFYDQMPESEKIFATVQLAEDLQPPGTDPALEDIEAWMAQQLKDYKVYGSMREG